MLPQEQIKVWGWALYFFGIFYCFIGIAFVTQTYINPAIDIVKVKAVVSSDTMNATLLAMTNSAAESFIIMNSIFFGNSDIGIYTVVGETAFYSLIIQGTFYLLADKNCKIDWWISTRETFFIMIYLCVFSGFLFGNDITLWKALILMAIYLVHIGFMKFNYIYEVLIKRAVAQWIEQRIKFKNSKEEDTKLKLKLNIHRHLRS